MKKILLSALLIGAGVATAAAQSFDIYLSNKLVNNVPADFVKISEGDVFEVNEKELSTPVEYDYDGQHFFMQTLDMMAYVKFHNNTLDDWEMQKQNSPAIGYTVASETTNGAEIGLTPSYITCIGVCVAANPFYFSCVNNSDTAGSQGDHLGYQIQCSEAGQGEKFSVDSKYDYTVTYGSEKLNFSIVYKAAGAAVEGVEAETAPAEYYTLQGVRVDNPEAGQVYIVRQGAKTYKVIR